MSDKPFSMAMGKAAKPRPAPTGPSAAGFDASASARPDKAEMEAVSEMVDGKVDAKSEAVLVIPKMANTFALGGAQHRRGELEGAAAAAAPSAEAGATALIAAPEPAAEEAAATPAAAAAASGAPAAPELGEDAQAAEALLSELRDGKGAAIFGSSTTDDSERYRLDVATRAEEAAPLSEAYEAMPIEAFGKAYMRGLGWEEGKGVKEGKPEVEAIEYVPRPQLLGLGAAPKKDEKEERQKNKKYIKPGESREAKKQMIYVDEQGRQRHVKKVGDALVEREASGFNKGALHAIVGGVHKGLYGRVMSTGGLEKDLKVVLKLTSSGEDVTVSSKETEPVRDARLERQQPGFTHQQHRQQEEQRRRGGERGGGGGGSGSGDEREHKHKRSRHRDEGEGHEERGHSEKHKRHKEERRDRDGGKGTRERGEAAVLDGGGGGGGGAGGGGGTRWVRESIRVRIVDKRLERGALYNKKGVVLDVSGADSFSVQMDESGKLYEGLRHDSCETALPKRGGSVLVSRGRGLHSISGEVD